MMNSETIKLDHIAKIEGHANLTVKLVNKKVEDANLEVFEGPRFFEAILLGRKFDEVAEMVARICGLCSVSHHITALKAVENALHIVPSEQTELLRELLYLGEIIQDHILHLYFLALPDYLGFPSAIAMASKFPREVKRAIRLRKLGNSILGEIGGRAVHTVSAVVNGFSVLPKEKMLKSLGERLKEARSDAIKTVDLIASLKLPEFKRKTEYVALRKDDEYPFLGGYICTSSGEKILPENYRNFLREYVNPYSTAKFSTYKGKSFMVGSLARLNLNHQQLSDTAKRCLERNDLEVPSHSPFINNFAQAVEVVHCIDRSIEIIESLRLKKEQAEVKIEAGEGVGVTEAPRGTLYHHYKINERGLVEYANIITPTTQNLKNIEEDVKKLLPEIIDLPRGKMTLELEKLIRSYDPCISCATHFLQVNII